MSPPTLHDLDVSPVADEQAREWWRRSWKRPAGKPSTFLRAVRTARSSVQGDDARPLIDDDRLSFQWATAADSRRASSCGMDTGVRDVSDIIGSAGYWIAGATTPRRKSTSDTRRATASAVLRRRGGGLASDLSNLIKSEVPALAPVGPI